MTDDIRYPDLPGHRGVQTSIEAAEAIAEDVGALQALSLVTIRKAGLNGYTAEELAAAVGRPRETIQPRTSELRRKGLIGDSGQRRRNASGKRAIVWVDRALLRHFERAA